MNNHTSVSFYSNTKDKTHCFQAVMKMICKYYFPNVDYSWEQMNKITQKKEGLWTWPMAGYVWLASKNVLIESMSIFDFRAFHEKGYDYLLKTFGKEVADEQASHADIAQGQMLAEQFMHHERITIETKIPSHEDIKQKLSDDYLVISNVNQKALNNEPGYSGHFVLIYHYNDTGYFLQDPGLPEFKNRHVNFDTFEKAWAYPDKNAKNLVAIKNLHKPKL